MSQQSNSELGVILNENFYVDLLRHVYKNSYYEFFKDAYKQLLPEEPYSDNWHIKYICDRLQKECFRVGNRKKRKKHIIINVPFRSAKSLMVTIMFPVWCWINFPFLKFIAVSYADDLALEHATASRSLLASNWFKTLFPEASDIRYDENKKSFYVNSRGGFRKSVGTGGQITGSGGDIIIVDDPQNPRRAASETERKNTVDFYDHTLISRLNQIEIGVIIVVQQRLHEQDLTGHLLKKNPETYELIKIPAQITQRVKPFPIELESFYKDDLFWSNRFTSQVIQEFIKSLGSLQAAGQLQQEPGPEEGTIFKREWFDLLEPSQVDRDIIENPMMFYIDTAETEKQVGDFSAIASMFKRHNCAYVADITTYKKEFYESCKYIISYTSSMRYSENSLIKIEPKSSGKSIVSQLRAATSLNVSELPSPKDDKITRAKACQPVLESKRVKFLNTKANQDFIDKLTLFPNVTNDDDVDAFIYGVTDMLLGSDFDFTFI